VTPAMANVTSSMIGTATPMLIPAVIASLLLLLLLFPYEPASGEPDVVGKALGETDT
jgi:hypothetical protein